MLIYILRSLPKPTTITNAINMPKPHAVITGTAVGVGVDGGKAPNGPVEDTKTVFDIVSNGNGDALIANVIETISAVVHV